MKIVTVLKLEAEIRDYLKKAIPDDTRRECASRDIMHIVARAEQEGL